MTTDIALQFNGAARMTTGSRHLLDTGDLRVLLDCGMVQGRRDADRLNRELGFDPTRLDHVILSHAHIDHSGVLPFAAAQGYGGPIHATHATADLCSVMLRDSAHIQEMDAKWLNERRRKSGKSRREKKGRGRPGRRDDEIQPLYTMDDAERCLEQFRTVAYHRPFRLGSQAEARFYDAGHILGSASVALDLRRDGARRRLVFSGDLGRVGLPLLRDPEIPHDADWLIMEGTYGAREHDPVGQAREELRETVERVAARGGKIIVPSFSVERTQEIVYHLNELHNEGRLPEIPVYVDSPLAVNVTQIFRLHPECFDEETRQTLRHDPDPFGFDRLTYVLKTEDSKRLNHIVFPCMIISASGMCTAGRIRHHLRNSIGDPKNCIMFVGYQAEGTLGRRIVERNRTVTIFGKRYPVRAEIVTLNTMSGHADRNALFGYARHVRDVSPNLKRVFLVHGEGEALETLGGRLRGELGLDVVIPKLGDRIALPE